MSERFSDHCQKAMAITNQHAIDLSLGYVGSEHILIGLIKEDGGTAAKALRQLGCDLTQLLSTIERLTAEPLPFLTPPRDGKLVQTPRAKRAIQFGVEEARSMGHDYVGTGHLLLGLLHEDVCCAWQVLANAGVSLDAARAKVSELSITKGE